MLVWFEKNCGLPVTKAGLADRKCNKEAEIIFEYRKRPEICPEMAENSWLNSRALWQMFGVLQVILSCLLEFYEFFVRNFDF